MKRKFKDQIIESGERCTILLYGAIGEYDDVRAADITRELLEAQHRYKEIDVRINSIGGDVYAGIAIFNALKNCKAQVHIYIDGLAASMASVIALCGHHVEMSRYARLMLHTVSGGCWGNKEEMAACIKDMEALEETLCEMCAQKLGMSKEEVRATYFDGKDHWLTAQQAFDAGFIDGIYDAEPVEDAQAQSIEQLYQTFQNRLVKQPQNSIDMGLIDSMKKRPGFTACATDEDVLRVVGELEEQAGKVDALTAENKELKKKNEAFEAKAKEQLEASKKAVLDAAEKDGRIDATTRPAYAALLDKDFESGKTTIDSLKPARRALKDIKTEPGSQESPWAQRMAEIKDRLKK